MPRNGGSYNSRGAKESPRHQNSTNPTRGESSAPKFGSVSRAMGGSGEVSRESGSRETRQDKVVERHGGAATRERGEIPVVGGLGNVPSGTGGRNG